jgi:hypothetical protein
MSSDVLVLGAMVVTVVATTWWSLTPVSTEIEDRPNRVDDVFDEAA